MTVMVTGASGVVGRALVPRLVAKDEVRAAVRRPEDAEALRAMGAKVTLGRLDDEAALEEVLRGVYTLIHLVGGPNQLDEDALWDANHRSVLRALAAARNARVSRFLLLSVPGADPEAADPFLRARGLAEEAVMTSGLDHAVIRCTHVYGLGGLWFTMVVEGALASPSLVVGTGHQELAPVLADDVAAVLAAADDRVGALGDTWGIEGPDVLTARHLVRMLAGADSEPMPVDGRAAAGRFADLLGAPVASWTIARAASASRVDAPDAAAAFGVAPTGLLDGLHATLARAAAVDGG